MQLFNKSLQQRVTAAPGLEWLDFFDALMNDDKSELQEHLALDGTHLNPKYVDLLEAALP